jgi:peptide/nickel transport system permease protein
MDNKIQGSDLNLKFDEAPLRGSDWKRFRRVFFGRKVVIYGVVIISLLVVTVIFTPLLAPYDPYITDVSNILARPSSAHLLGTDTLGRDILSRIIYGSRNALFIGLIAVGFAATAGMLLGLIAGYFGGMISAVIMRIIDSIQSIPMIMFAITIAAFLGGGLKNVIMALGVAMIAPYARLMCGQVLSIKQNDYILRAKASGAGDFSIMFKHIVPNCFPPLIVLMTMQVGNAILSEASLSFLGVGIKAPEAAWGSMVSEGYRYLLRSPQLSVVPGLAIMIVVFAYNMVGDGLRDALDPKLRGIL